MKRDLYNRKTFVTVRFVVEKNVRESLIAVYVESYERCGKYSVECKRVRAKVNAEGVCNGYMF